MFLNFIQRAEKALKRGQIELHVPLNTCLKLGEAYTREILETKKALELAKDLGEKLIQTKTLLAEAQLALAACRVKTNEV